MSEQEFSISLMCRTMVEPCENISWKFNLLNFDFPAEFKVLKELNGCLLGKLRTIVISFNHEMCL